MRYISIPPSGSIPWFTGSGLIVAGTVKLCGNRFSAPIAAASFFSGRVLKRLIALILGAINGGGMAQRYRKTTGYGLYFITM
jgi:hypothetical protein